MTTEDLIQQILKAYPDATEAEIRNWQQSAEEYGQPQTVEEFAEWHQDGGAK